MSKASDKDAILEKLKAYGLNNHIKDTEDLVFFKQLKPYCNDLEADGYISIEDNSSDLLNST